MGIKLTPIPQIPDREPTNHETLLLQLLRERDECIQQLSDANARLADEIINSVLEPFRKHLVNLERYRKEYRKQVDKQYPLDKTLVQDLKDWGRQVLGLQDEDIEQIEQDINAKKEAEHQHQQEAQQQKQEEYNDKLKQYKQKFSKAVEQEYPLSNSARNQINILQQSPGMRTEDIKRIEQPILATKYQEKLKEKERQGQHGQVSTSQPLVTPVATPNATTTSSSSSSQNKSSTPQPKLPPASSTTTPAEDNSNLRSSPQKTRILVGSGIAAALALALTFSWSSRTPQSEPNLNPPPTVSEQESPATSPHMTAEDFFDRGLDKRKKGDNQGAIEDYTKAIELNPDYATAYYNRGIAHSDLKEYQQAIADYTESIRLKNPELWVPYNGRGIAHSDLKEYQKAIADYSKAIELNPDYATAYYNRGIAHSDLKEYQKAIADYSKVIELNPDYANAYYNRGNTHKSLKDNQAVVNDYKKAANLYKQQGKTDDYQDAINQIKKLEK